MASDLARLGSTGQPVRGLYRLEFSRLDPAPFA
jgi:hypothetical protein